MSSIYDWSLTAASNDIADGDINWQENQFPDTVNNSARAMMMRGAEWRDDLSGSLVSGGTANALTVTAKSAFTSLIDGRVLSLRASLSNTGAATLNVNGLGGKAIRKMTASGDAAIAANEIRAGGIYDFKYSSTANGAAGAWMVLNPTFGTTLTLTSATIGTANYSSYSGVPISSLVPGTVAGALIEGQDSGHLVLGIRDNDANDSVSIVSYDGTGAYSKLVAAFRANGATVLDAVTAGLLTVSGTGSFTGAVSTGALTVTGTATATSFSGSGASLTALNASNLASGIVPDARFPATLPAASGVNLTALNASNLASGTVPNARFPATLPAASGINLTSLNASNLASGTVASARVSGSYTGITGTGALNAGSIGTGFGNINIGASQFATTGIASFGALSATTGTFSGNVTSSGNVAAAVSYSLSTTGNTTRLRYTTTGVATRFALRDDTLGADVMSMDTSGNATFVGDVTANSDRKLKKHIKPIKGALDLVRALRGVRFTRRRINTKSIGFIAQEVEEFLPELVHEGENGKSVAYANFAAVLVEAVKELAAKVERLEASK